MPLDDGQIFAGYTILRLLGRGGMGEVYLAQHPRLPRTDALKVLAANISADTQYRARFNREADLASSLYHPHIVGVHDRGEEDGRLWISMDYVDGLDAAHLLASRFPNGMPAHRVTAVITAVASALDYAHDRGLLHRDVKPANILLTDSAREQRILLADFGIARDVNDSSGLTGTNLTVGTVAYAAPEQLMGQQLDGRADQYALAATAYQLFTGSQLFPHSNVAAVIGQHLNAAPPALGAAKPELAHCDAVLATALAKNPEHRFASCSDFARALAAQVERNRDAAMPPTIAAPVAAPYPQLATSPVNPQNGSSLRWPLIIGAVVVLAMLGVLALAMRPSHQDRDAVEVTVTATSTATAVVPEAPTPTPPAITFAGMRDFITAYYAQLPANPQHAWTLLDADYQDRSGYDSYLQFWSTINSVAVLDVSPRDSTSVLAHIQYTFLDGHSQDEDRWLRVVVKDGVMLIYNSDLA